MRSCASVITIFGINRRGLHLEKAYGTLTEYCIHELGYGDSSAGRRVRAARVIAKVPEVYDLLKKKELTFCAVVQVHGVLTPENKESLLPRSLQSWGKSPVTVTGHIPQLSRIRHQR